MLANSNFEAIIIYIYIIIQQTQSVQTKMFLRKLLGPADYKPRKINKEGSQVNLIL